MGVGGHRSWESTPVAKVGPVGALVDLPVHVRQAIFEFGLILLPRLAIHSWDRVTLQGVKAFPKKVDGDMVQQGSEPYTPIPPRYFCTRCSPSSPRAGPAFEGRIRRGSVSVWITDEHKGGPVIWVRVRTGFVGA